MGPQSPPRNARQWITSPGGDCRRGCGRPGAMMRLLPKLRAIGSVVLAGALAACGSSALYGVPGAESPGSSSPAKPYNVSRLIDPAGGKLLGVQAPGAPDALGPVQTFATSAGARPNLIGEHMA